MTPSTSSKPVPPVTTVLWWPVHHRLPTPRPHDPLPLAHSMQARSSGHKADNVCSPSYLLLLLASISTSFLVNAAPFPCFCLFLYSFLAHRFGLLCLHMHTHNPRPQRPHHPPASLAGFAILDPRGPASWPLSPPPDPPPNPTRDL